MTQDGGMGYPRHINNNSMAQASDRPIWLAHENPGSPDMAGGLSPQRQVSSGMSPMLNNPQMNMGFATSYNQMNPTMSPGLQQSYHGNLPK